MEHIRFEGVCKNCKMVYLRRSQNESGKAKILIKRLPDGEEQIHDFQSIQNTGSSICPLAANTKDRGLPHNCIIAGTIELPANLPDRGEKPRNRITPGKTDEK